MPDLPESFHPRKKGRVCAVSFIHLFGFTFLYENVTEANEDDSQIDSQLLVSLGSVNSLVPFPFRADFGEWKQKVFYFARRVGFFSANLGKRR
jgi:hypothetical protein